MLGQLLVVGFNPTRTDPWSNGSAKLELAIYYGEPNRISRLKISGGVTLDLGSVHKLTGDVTSGTGPALAALCAYWARHGWAVHCASTLRPQARKELWQETVQKVFRF